MTTSPPPAPITLVYRNEAPLQGWSDGELRRSQRRGDLVRVRRGSYGQPSRLVDLYDRESTGS